MLFLFWNLQHQGNQDGSKDTVEIMKVAGKVRDAWLWLPAA